MALSGAYDLISINIGFQEYVININSGFCKQFDISYPVKKGDANERSLLVSEGDSHTILIRYCTALAPCGKWYAAVTARKTLLLRDTNSWSLISERSIERNASKIIFTPSSDYIILTDKTGDVYSYSVIDPLKPGTFLLGHISVLLDVLITPDEKFIITCDRDEKIRVSHFPNAYNICSFCLGHKEYVIKITTLNNETLISASGDGTIKLWNYKNGAELLTHTVSHDIELYLTNDQDRPDDFKCSINYMSEIYRTEHSSYFCISVNKRCNVFVYKIIDDDFSLTCIQKIDVLSEPLSLLLSNTGLLWVLLCTENETPFMTAMIWDNGSFKANVSEEIKNSLQSLNIVFKNNKVNNQPSNLGGLYKNSKLSYFKRIKKQ